MESLEKQVWCYCQASIVFLQAGRYLSLSSPHSHYRCSSRFSSGVTAAIVGTAEGRCSSFMLLENSEPQHLNNITTSVLTPAALEEKGFKIVAIDFLGA